MYILGLNSYAHDAACALLKDGQIKAIIEEERCNREKHTWHFPKKAIEQCLRMEGISITDIDAFTFFWTPYQEILGNMFHVLRYFPESLNLFRAPSGSYDLSFSQRLQYMQQVGQEIKRQFHLVTPPKVHFIEHHLAHAASAFFVSPYDDAAILTIDGRGESVTTLMAMGQGMKIKKIKEIKVPHSLGHLYAALTDFLGFRHFFDEWKVMGMAAYGRDVYVKDFDKLVTLTKDGFKLNLNYFQFHTHGQCAWLSQEFFDRFGRKRQPEESYDQHYFDLAYALQTLVEKVGVHLANVLYKKTKTKNLCMTGGVALNCLMNKKIVEETPFDNFFFQPIASDAGTSLGSALYHHHQVLGNPRHYVFDSVYYGLEFNDVDIEAALIKKSLKYKRSNDIAKDTARYIADGEIVGWFQGRMEAGPRALGNRSITVSPLDPHMKERLNARVKKREFYRPFAPSVLEEKVDQYFVMPRNQPSPYMILVGDVLESKRSVIPAITHHDGTARVHTVSQKVNPKYWQLIAEFEKITGVPVLLNTSFNENEPIVCTPEEAIACFLRTDFDVLAIGDFLILKSDNQESIK